MDEKKTPEANVPPRRRGLRYWLPRVALLLGTLVLCLALGEAVVRAFNLGPEITAVAYENYQLSENPILRYELAPGSQFRQFRVNSAGLRGAEVSLEKPEGVVRIACLGDSVTFGSGAREEGTYPVQLQRMLNAAAGDATRYEVLNFGITGYNITQNLETLRIRALRYRPDIVTYQYCVNDPQEYSFELEGLLEQLSVAEKQYVNRTARAKGWMMESSRLFAVATFAWQSKREAYLGKEERPPDEQWTFLSQGGWEEYFRGLHDDPAGWRRVEVGFDELAELSRQHGFRPLVVIFPVIRKLEAYPLDDVHARVIEAAEARGLPVEDLLPVFQELNQHERRRFQRDALHPNGIGYAAAARAMIERMRAEGMLPAS